MTDDDMLRELIDSLADLHRKAEDLRQLTACVLDALREGAMDPSSYCTGVLSITGEQLESLSDRLNRAYADALAIRKSNLNGMTDHRG